MRNYVEFLAHNPHLRVEIMCSYTHTRTHAHKLESKSNNIFV